MKMQIKKKLAMLMDIGLHCKVKQICAEKNMTMTEWIMEAIIEKLKQEMDLGY